MAAWRNEKYKSVRRAGLNGISCASTPDFFQRLNKSFIVHTQGGIATKRQKLKILFFFSFFFFYFYRAKKEEMVDTSFRLLFLLLLLLSFIDIKRREKEAGACRCVYSTASLMNCRWNRTAARTKEKDDEGYIEKWEENGSILFLCCCLNSYRSALFRITLSLYVYINIIYTCTSRTHRVE